MYIVGLYKIVSLPNFIVKIKQYLCQTKIYEQNLYKGQELFQMGITGW
jgi:hypothetical protein